MAVYATELCYSEGEMQPNVVNVSVIRFSKSQALYTEAGDVKVRESSVTTAAPNWDTVSNAMATISLCRLRNIQGWLLKLMRMAV